MARPWAILRDPSTPLRSAQDDGCLQDSKPPEPQGGRYSSRSFISHNDFHLNVLKRELVMNETKQLERAGIRYVHAMHLDPRRFARELRMAGLHFAIEQK